MNAMKVAWWLSLGLLAGCGRAGSGEPSTAGTRGPERAAAASVAWRLERFEDLGLEAEVFRDAPTNRALYVALVEWDPSEDEHLRIQLDSDPEMPDLAPLVPQEGWRSSDLEETTVCGEPARMLRVTRTAPAEPRLEEVRVQLHRGTTPTLVTWSVESDHPERWTMAERRFFASIRCTGATSDAP